MFCVPRISFASTTFKHFQGGAFSSKAKSLESAREAQDISITNKGSSICTSNSACSCRQIEAMTQKATIPNQNLRRRNFDANSAGLLGARLFSCFRESRAQAQVRICFKCFLPFVKLQHSEVRLQKQKSKILKIVFSNIAQQ
jgi:hypothetical protein